MPPRSLLALPLLVTACATGTTTPDATQVAGTGTPADPYRLCHDNGGPMRTDYPFVGNYVCPDGSRPLGGSPEAGAQARLRNVGRGPHGNVVDEYEVPCNPPVRIYVDAYFCPESNEDPEVVAQRTRARVADLFLSLETLPFDERAGQLRSEAPAYVDESPDVEVTVCDGPFEFVSTLPSPYAELLTRQLYASLTAAIMMSSNAPEDRAAAYTQAMAGVLRMYRVIVDQRGQGAAIGALDELLGMAADLGRWTEAKIEGCTDAPPPTMGMTMTREGQNVWPPRGEGCEALIRCCEKAGAIVNGASVGPEGLVCLLAAADDCREGLVVVQSQLDCS
ncbi:MAG: hypothetical protein AAGH15_03050 [Myxococcota bacterium]